MSHAIQAEAIEALIAQALERAGEKASKAGVARGVLAGLRLIRQNIEEQLGYGATRQFDEVLRNALIGAAADRLRSMPDAEQIVHPRHSSTGKGSRKGSRKATGKGQSKADKGAELPVVRTGSAATVPVPSPAEAPGGARSVAIITDTVRTCLMLNGMAPGNLCLNVAASTLTRQLVSLLGGVPEWAGVMAAVRVEESDEEAEEGAGSAISYLQ